MADLRMKLKGPNTGQRLDVVDGIPYGRASLLNAPYSIMHLQNKVIQRFEVRSGDRGYSGDAANGNERAELVTWRAPSSDGYRGPNVLFDEDVWLAYSFMIEPGSPVLGPGSETSRNLCVGQWHDVIDPGDTIGLSPVLLWQLDPGTDNIGFRVRSRGDSNPIQSQPTFNVYEDHFRTELKRGEWVHLVQHARFNADGLAVLEVWMNGNKVVNRIGTAEDPFIMGFKSSVPDLPAAYWQYGIYRTGNANTLAVQYANMTQSKTSLLARVANPLPIYPSAVITSLPDTTPSDFSIPAQTDVALSSVIISASVTVSGVAASVPVGVEGGEYSIDGGSFTSAPGTVNNGQSVRVRLTSSASNSTVAKATLSIGGIRRPFSVTTVAAGGVTPGDTPPPPAAGMVLNYQTDFVSTANKRSGGTMQSVPFVISPNNASPPADAWLSCFPYGRIVNNNEAGLYADPTIMTGVDPFPIVSGVRTLQSGPITNGNGYIEINGLRYRYYASLITSRWAFTVTDGDYVEVDFSCPGVFGNKGQWPAFWLLKAAALGANNEWPPEIDVLEWPQVIDAAGGSKIDEYWSNQHRVSAGALPDTINFPAKGLTGNVEGRHRYGIRITNANIQLYVDDTLVRTMTNYAPGIEWYVILNLALGGDWPNGFNAYPQSPAGSNTYPNGTPPTPNGQTTFPGTMRLYNIRHYKPS